MSWLERFDPSGCRKPLQSPRGESLPVNSLKQGKKQGFSLISADFGENRCQKPNDSSRFRGNSLGGRTGTFFCPSGNSNSLIGWIQGYLAPDAPPARGFPRVSAKASFPIGSCRSPFVKGGGTLMRRTRRARSPKGGQTERRERKRPAEDGSASAHLRRFWTTSSGAITCVILPQPPAPPWSLVKARRFGNSLAVVFPKEAIRRLNTQESATPALPTCASVLDETVARLVQLTRSVGADPVSNGLPSVDVACTADLLLGRLDLLDGDDRRPLDVLERLGPEWETAIGDLHGSGRRQ